jgi:hypothetical protein
MATKTAGGEANEPQQSQLMATEPKIYHVEAFYRRHSEDELTLVTGSRLQIKYKHRSGMVKAIPLVKTC